MWRGGEVACIEAAAEGGVKRCRSAMRRSWTPRTTSIVVRLERGDPVSIEEFCDQFPGFRTTLRRQIEIHHLIVDHPSLFRECVETAWPKPGDTVLSFS